jgi:uncharacterized protein YdaU (DUF1376 family)
MGYAMKDEKLLYASIYLMDYFGSVRHLNLAQKGAHITLVLEYWERSGNLPNNSKQLHIICGCKNKSERDVVDAIAAEFFAVEGNWLFNDTIDKSISKAKTIRDRNRYIAEKRSTKTLPNGHQNGHQNSTRIAPKPPPYDDDIDT